MNLPLELQFLTENISNHKKKINVGDLVFFGYESLESFYDRFPLVLILSVKRSYDFNFLGFNFHYMPPEIRLLVLNEIKNNGVGGAKKMSQDDIPRRYFTNAIRSYNLSNVITPIKVFGESEINKVINTIVPTYDSKLEVNIIKHLDKVFVEEKRG